MNALEKKTEEKYAALLNKARRKTPKKEKAGGEGNENLKSKPSITEFSLMLFLAAFADTLDFLLVGLVPFVGDIIDILMLSTIIVWTLSLAARKYLGLSTFTTLALSFGGFAVEEIIPLLGDLLPMWIGAVWFVYKKSGKIKFVYKKSGKIKK